MNTEIKNIVESIIFASEEEITSKEIKEVIESSGLRVGIDEIEEIIKALNDEYLRYDKSFEILKIGGGHSFATKPEYGRFIGRLFEDKQKKKLSQSALETLSIIAYKQPITRSEIEFIRGVNVDYIVNSLMERELITIQGRADTPGRPILYSTTKTFLKVLGLNSLDDLPRLKEINEILKNEEIEGITEADLELFNSVNNPEIYKQDQNSSQLELITNETIEEGDQSESDISEDEVSISPLEENVINLLASLEDNIGIQKEFEFSEKEDEENTSDTDKDMSFIVKDDFGKEDKPYEKENDENVYNIDKGPLKIIGDVEKKDESSEDENNENISDTDKEVHLEIKEDIDKEKKSDEEEKDENIKEADTTKAKRDEAGDDKSETRQ